MRYTNVPRSNFTTCEEAKKFSAPGGEYALMNWGWGDSAAVSTGCLQSTHQAAHNHL